MIEGLDHEQLFLAQ